MTSGLFDTGVTGDSAEYTSSDLTVQPSTSDAKLMGDEFSAETFDSDFDMAMLGDLGAGFADPLGDASMDSFTDLTALLTENTFFDHAMEEKAMPVTLTDLDAEVKVTKNPLKRSLVKVEETSDLATLSANVGLTVTRLSSSDHDYSAKRPRMSTVTEEPSVENVDEVFLVPAPSPAPSTASGYGEPIEDKYRNRREKNNIASKRSREIRKRKFADMETEADRLIVENACLEKRVVQLEELAKRMKEILVAKMAGK